MEVSLTCAVFCLAAFSVLWKEIDAVQCYQCSGCNDPFKESEAGVTVVDCPNACLKTKAESGSVQVVTRGCWDFAENKCSKQSQGGAEADVCVCTTDKCNGVESLTAYNLTFVVASAFVVLLKQMFF